MLKSVAPIALALLTVSCQTDGPAAPEPSVPNLAVAGNSGCYAVKFKWDGLGFGLFFTGPLSGDLEGSSDVNFDPNGITPQTGVTNTAASTTTFNVSGGVIPELTGGSFDVSGLNRNFFRPDNDPGIVENNGRARALSGVQKANLTWTGWAAFVGPTEIEVHIDFQGVICP